MPKRIQLRFNRSYDTKTTEYRILRAEHPGVTENSLLVMRVAQSNGANPIHIKGEQPIQVGPLAYQLANTNILSAFPFTVYENGVPTTDVFNVDYVQGLIVFDSISGSNLITADYTFDGMTVVDDSIANQPFVTQYNGPPAVDPGNVGVPYNIETTINDDSTVTFTCTSDPSAGKDYYYRALSVDSAGNRSILTPEIHALLQATMSELYVEQSSDLVTWTKDGTGYPYTTKPTSSASPNPVQNLTHVASYSPDGTEATIHFSWLTPPPVSFTTPSYRLTAQTGDGGTSPTSEPIGPFTGHIGIKQIVLEYAPTISQTGTPTYGESGVETIALSPSMTDYYVGVPAGQEYVYAFYTVDVQGNVSIPNSVTIDTTSPA